VALIAAFFALGGALSAGLAHRLGAFDPPPPDALHFAERAREALRAGAFDAPQGDNVREITDSALRTWPGSEPILRVRRDAASKLLERARSERERDRAAGVRDAELALELDSGNEAARALLAELREQAVAVPVSIPEGNGAVTAASTRSSPPKRASKAPIPRAAPNTAEPPLKQAPQSGEPEQPARAAPDKPVEGGRWL
jgi:hypothetical protein